MYISENGGMVCDGREIVSFEAMTQQLVCAAVELARGLPNVHAIASMRDGAAYEDDDPVFVENMAMYYARRKKVPDLLEAAAGAGVQGGAFLQKCGGNQRAAVLSADV